jgi:hypothetical protein
MKRPSLLFITFAAFVLLSSCKRDYTCYCYEAYSPAEYPVKAASEDDAEVVCNSYTTSWRDCLLQ